MNIKEIKKGRHPRIACPRVFLSGIPGISLIGYINKGKSLFIHNTKAGDSRQQLSGMTTLFHNGFTLIELLVVVLIIGILAAIALPQYQKAVQKTRLMRLVPLVTALRQAEEDYYLANGTYTNDLDALAVSIGDNGCSYVSNVYGNYYFCNGYLVGIFNDATNAQVQVTGGNNVAYMQFFDDLDTEPSGVKFKKGQTVCFSTGETSRQICRSLGPGEEKEHGQGWDYIYILH